jgi:hypothetical protein
VTIVGNQVTLRGKAAQEVEDCCRLTGIEPKTLLTKMLQVSVERYKIEKPKRLEDLDWEAWANLMYQRLQGRKAGDRAKS